ncbi:molecular chaperone [Lelliottia sp. RWM.1]|uniref:fimbrial biogenesis chaperone n=1 Tax=Lelliottia sp. RWM.1 TaxID=2663242 RepID=UPI00193DE9B5|nr:fimbria/pilus periplasmic chaperone [Lelliottia sp. RWM.1]MBM3070839.1 fimbria/pilus periplasmic chaperone [Lelliottia sp. RWM.1]
MKSILNALLACTVVASAIPVANSGVIIGGTRVVFDGARKEASISVSNPDDADYLIQSWIESEHGGEGRVPFIITPPLYRLDKGQKNVERIVMTAPLSQVSESLYWLNIKTIPSMIEQENVLQIAVKTRIKLIYRPESLSAASPEEQAGKLIWTRTGRGLHVHNPTRYIINFNEIYIDGKSVEDVSYVLPGMSKEFSFPAAIKGSWVAFSVINDYGSAGDMHKVRL